MTPDRDGHALRSPVGLILLAGTGLAHTLLLASLLGGQPLGASLMLWAIACCLPALIIGAVIVATLACGWAAAVRASGLATGSRGQTEAACCAGRVQ